MRATMILVIAIASVSLTGCATGPPGAHPTGVDVDIDGTYVNVVTEQELRAAGLEDATDILENTGTFEFTFEDGVWSFTQTTDHDVPSGQTQRTGSFTVRGNAFTIYWSQENRADVTRATVSINSEGALVFTNVDDPFAPQLSNGFFATEPWPRVAG